MAITRRHVCMVGVAALLLAGSAGLGQALLNPPLSQDAIRVTATAEWADRFSTLSELVAASDVIVVATLTAPDHTVLLHPEDAADPGAPFVTIWSAHVERQVRGAPVPADILVAQTGGVRNGVTLQLTDEALFEPGARYVLFLRQSEGLGSDPVLVPAGGPQGEWRVAPEGVFSTDHFMEGAWWIRVRAEGEPLDALLDRVREAAA